MNIIPVFLPHEGCESHCTFCNEYSATGLKKLPVREEILSTVQRYLSYFVDKNNVELAFYGGTFTGSKRQKIYLDIGLELFERKVIKGYASLPHRGSSTGKKPFFCEIIRSVWSNWECSLSIHWS